MTRSLPANASAGDEPVSQLTDTDPNTTYAAVGRALSEWETMEALLAELYSIFVDNPGDVDAMVGFGIESEIFADRMKSLVLAACVFFRRHPDQIKEASFDQLVDLARLLSKRRHQIAHGSVMRIHAYGIEPGTKEWLEAPSTYWLAPPLYAIHHLTKVDGVYYHYGSNQINQIADEFRKCAALARTLADQLCAGSVMHAVMRRAAGSPNEQR